MMAADTIDIAWGGLTLNHEGPYLVEMITGWEDLPAPRINDVARMDAHGSFDAPVRLGSRTVVAEGHCNTQEARDSLLLNLARVMVPASGNLTVTFAGRTLTSRARLARSGRTLRDWGVGCFGWQIEWWAPDPFRYGSQVTGTTGLPEDTGGLVFPLFDGTPGLDFGDLGSPGRITMDNPGTADAYPVYTVTGPVPSGFEIRHLETGRRLRWGTAVPTGSVITLDNRTGGASYDDSPGWDGALTKRQWHTIPAGGSATVQFTGLGSYDAAANLTASWAPTYW